MRNRFVWIIDIVGVSVSLAALYLIYATLPNTQEALAAWVRGWL